MGVGSPRHHGRSYPSLLYLSYHPGDGGGSARGCEPRAVDAAEVLQASEAEPRAHGKPQKRHLKKKQPNQPTPTPRNPTAQTQSEQHKGRQGFFYLQETITFEK